MNAQELRAAHFAYLQANWPTMPAAELRVDIRGVLSAHFLYSELDAPGLAADRPTRFAALLAHYDALGDVELREAVGGLLPAHVELRDRVIAARGEDPVLFATSLLEGVNNGQCDAILAHQSGAPDAEQQLETQKLRWIRIPPIGL